MRAHRVAERPHDAGERLRANPRSVSAQIERFMNSMAEAVDIATDSWQEAAGCNTAGEAGCH